MGTVIRTDRQCWIAVACAAHVRRGLAEGFMQVCHGKGGPLKRLRPGDGIAYYSPTEILGDKQPLRTFTAIGTVRDNRPYQADMGNGFTPFRRDVTWAVARPTPIQPLLDQLAFTADRRNWGYQLRFGLIEIEPHDLDLIAAAMGVEMAGAGHFVLCGQAGR